MYMATTEYVDYSVTWGYLCRKMAEKGIITDEPHEMAYYLRKLEEIFNEYPGKRFTSPSRNMTMTVD